MKRNGRCPTATKETETCKEDSGIPPAGRGPSWPCAVITRGAFKCLLRRLQEKGGPVDMMGMWRTSKCVSVLGRGRPHGGTLSIPCCVGAVEPGDTVVGPLPWGHTVNPEAQRTCPVQGLALPPGGGDRYAGRGSRAPGLAELQG